MTTTRIYFSDLSWEKQEQIREWVKEEVLEELREEAKEKNKSLENLLKEDYNVGYDMTDEEKKEHWQILVENFLDEQVNQRLGSFYAEASWD